MPDAPLTASVESTALIAALDRLGVSVETYTKPTAKITADNIAREAKARVARRTGETAAGIVVDEDVLGPGQHGAAGGEVAALVRR